MVVNGKTLEKADGPAVLWRALNDGKEIIAEGLKDYRQEMRARHPDLSILPNTPIRLIHLGVRPRDVLTAEAMDKYNTIARDYHDPEDIREDLLVFWQAAQAAGFIPELRLMSTRSGWEEMYLWAIEPPDSDRVV